MSLANTSITGVSVPTASEREILTWTADGSKKFAGFFGTGEGNAEFRLYKAGVYVASANINTAKPNADFIDLPYTPVSGTNFSLRVYHELGSNKYFGGCFLGN